MNKPLLIAKRTFKYLMQTLKGTQQASWKSLIEGISIDLERQSMYESVLKHYPDNSPESKKYKDELNYIKHKRSFFVSPYEPFRMLPHPEAGFDKEVQLPYILHNKKRLYFPESWTIKEMTEYYIHAISTENILATENPFMPKTPHRYQTPLHKIEDGDILIDAGTAEGLFTLDNIETVEKAIIVECDKQWLKPLKQTFLPYSEKVEIVFKMLGARDDTNTISLPTIIKKESGKHFFVKMDIEGAEVACLKASIEYLKTCNRNIKLSCCTYHNNEDYTQISTILDKIGFHQECSDGYMLIYDYKSQRPFFRHGVIRGTLSHSTNP